MDRAACQGASRSTFFPDNRHNDRKRAVQICLGCPVRSECLEFHLGVEEIPHGVAGALSGVERQAVLA